MKGTQAVSRSRLKYSAVLEEPSRSSAVGNSVEKRTGVTIFGDRRGHTVAVVTGGKVTSCFEQADAQRHAKAKRRDFQQ